MRERESIVVPALEVGDDEDDDHDDEEEDGADSEGSDSTCRRQQYLVNSCVVLVSPNANCRKM